MPESPGTIGFEVMRGYLDSHPTSKLVGAFRGQAQQPLHRFGNGSGTFHGPYFGISQPSARLTFAQFQHALMELCLDLPDSEAEAIFCTIAGSIDGLISLPDLLRELHAEPCDRSQRWRPQRIGQVWTDGRPAPSASVQPTRRSGYTVGGYRPAPPPPEPPLHHRAPPPPPPEHRVAPTLSNQFVNGANVLAAQWTMGPSGDMGRAPPPPLPPKTSYGRPTSGYPIQLLHGDPDEDNRWEREGIGQTRPPWSEGGPVRVLPVQRSGFTASIPLELGNDEPEVPPPPQLPPGPVRVVGNKPSGYNRGNATNVLKEAWAEKEWQPRAKPEPREYRVAPTLSSGFTRSCSLCEADRVQGRPGKCAFCRMHG